MALFSNKGGGGSNWDRIRNQSLRSTMRYRDVYEDQQLERTSLNQRRSPTSRIILAVVLALVSMGLFWLIISFVEGIRWSMENGSFIGNQWGAAQSHLSFLKVFLTLIVGVGVYALFYVLLMKQLKIQDGLVDNSDINQYQNDQHIAMPEELQEKFDWFPDVGATSDVQFSSMISHMALANKGLKQVDVSQRAKEDIVEDGDIVLYKGEVLVDERTGRPLTTKQPMIDIDFMEALYDASGVPKNKGKDKIRKYYDATKIPYNPLGDNRDKLGKFDTVADLINADWQLPYYEPQRPGGAYLVDTAPVV